MAILARIASGLVLAGFTAGAAMAADAPTFLGQAGAWSAYQANTSSGMVCYALSQPTKSLPAGARRDPIYFIISDWPGRKVKGEVEFVSGYPFKDGSNGSADVGSTSVDLFTSNDGGSGSAWIVDAGQERGLVEAIRKGDAMIVKGVSKRGTHTTDTFSLTGAGDMIDRAHAACPQ